MSDKPQLPEGNIDVPDTYSFSGAPWMNIRQDHGKHLMKLAESVEDTINSLYGRATERRRKDRNGKQDEELDEELTSFIENDALAALEDLGKEIEKARELEKDIGTDRYFGEGSHVDYHLSQDEIPEREKEFLDNYRKAETMYRHVLKKFEKGIDGMELNAYLEDRYGVDLLDEADLPVPRHHGQ